MGHGKAGGRQAGRGFSYDDIVEIDVCIAIAIVGSALEHDDHTLGIGVFDKVDFFFRPIACVGESSSKTGGVRVATIGGDIHREVTTIGVLVPEAQLHHGVGREVEDWGLQKIGFVGAIAI